jgi:AcrR family transcriptional regulator
LGGGTVRTIARHGFFHLGEVTFALAEIPAPCPLHAPNPGYARFMTQARKTTAPRPIHRQANRDLKRTAVLETAVGLFNDKGFRATSIDEIALALHVTKPTIYNYFGSKDEILFECVRLGMQATLDAAQAVERRGGSGLGRLKALIHDLAIIATQPFGKCVTRTADHDLSEESRARFRALKKDTEAAIRAIVQAGIEDGSIAAADPRLVSFCISGALNWISRWYEDDGRLAPGDIADAYVAILTNGIAARRS